MSSPLAPRALFQCIRRYALSAFACAAGLPLLAAADAEVGALDPAFGTHGMVVTTFPGGGTLSPGFEQVHVLPDGRMLLSATVNRAGIGNSDFGVLRLHADGSIDASFGEQGASLVAFDQQGSEGTDVLIDMAVQADGKIVLAGGATTAINGYDMAVARLTADGALDAGFGDNGRVLIGFDLGSTPAARIDAAWGLAVLADGRIQLAGSAALAGTGGSVLAVAQLTASGQLDVTFDGDGKRFVSFSGTATEVGTAHDLIALADSARTVAVGSIKLAGNADFALVRMWADGSLDESFGDGGKVRFGFDVADSLQDVATSVLELPGDKLLVCGFAIVGTGFSSDIACIRVLENGSIDPEYLPQLIPFDRGGANQDAPRAMTADAQGRVLIAASVQVADDNHDFALVRLTQDGLVDPSFGEDGRATYGSAVSPAPDRVNEAYSVAVQPDGRILLAGSARLHDVDPTRGLQVVRVLGDEVFRDGFEGHPPTLISTINDGPNMVGIGSSIAVGEDGMPVVSYHDATAGVLKIAACTDSACAGPAIISTIAEAGHDVGAHSSIAIGSNGFPLISYLDATADALMLASCTNATCTGTPLIITVDAAGGIRSSLAIGDDERPVIAHVDQNSNTLKIASCSAADCTGAVAITHIDNASSWLSLAIGADGNPVVAYYDGNIGALKVAHCPTSNCTGTTTINVVDGPGNDVGAFTSIAVGVDGFPVVSYLDDSGGALKVAHCGNASCSAAMVSVVDGPPHNVGAYTATAIGNDGMPVIAYRDNDAGALKVARCGDLACAGVAILATVDDSANHVGNHTSIAIGHDGLPVISYQDQTAGSLKVVRCGTPGCESP